LAILVSGRLHLLKNEGSCDGRLLGVGTEAPANLATSATSRLARHTELSSASESLDVNWIIRIVLIFQRRAIEYGIKDFMRQVRD